MRSRALALVLAATVGAAGARFVRAAGLDEAALAAKGIVKASPYVPGRPSVVVVHGADPDPKNFENLVDELKKDHNVFFFVYRPEMVPANLDATVAKNLGAFVDAREDVEDASRQFDDAVREMVRQTGDNSMVVVAHSAGGLVARDAMSSRTGRHSNDTLARAGPGAFPIYLVTLNTPFGGIPSIDVTGSTIGGFFASVFSFWGPMGMADSPFLNGKTGTNVELFSFYSKTDGVVTEEGQTLRKGLSRSGDTVDEWGGNHVDAVADPTNVKKVAEIIREIPARKVSMNDVRPTGPPGAVSPLHGAHYAFYPDRVMTEVSRTLSPVRYHYTYNYFERPNGPGGEWRLLHAPDASAVNLALVNDAPVLDPHQNMGGSVLSVIDNAVVLARAESEPSGSWASDWKEREILMRPRLPGESGWGRRRIFATRAQADGGGGAPSAPTSPPNVKAVFTSLGKSTGPAFSMTLVHDSAQPLKLIGALFVLEPVKGVTAQQAERELSKVKGRRITATIDAYCLDKLKAPPLPGIVYRLAANKTQERHADVARIMRASKVLHARKKLNPDSDLVEYYHSIRQWSVWTREQGYDEPGFTRALLEHTKQNLEKAGRRWTSEIEAAARAIVPNRWRDVQQVLAEARR